MTEFRLRDKEAAALYLNSRATFTKFEWRQILKDSTKVTESDEERDGKGKERNEEKPKVNDILN